MELLDFRMHDGSRQFYTMQKTIAWNDLISRLERLNRLVVKEFLPSLTLGSWLEFSFKGYNYCVNEQMGMYWFLVKDPTCPEEILVEVVETLS